MEQSEAFQLGKKSPVDTEMPHRQAPIHGRAAVMIGLFRVAACPPEQRGAGAAVGVSAPMQGIFAILIACRWVSAFAEQGLDAHGVANLASRDQGR